MTALVVAAVLVGGVWGQEAAKPQKEHQWLAQLAGEWDTEADMVVAPGNTVKTKGTESTRLIGGLWAVSEFKGDFMGTPFNGLMTVGYDPALKKYVGTWVCSMCDHITKYEGSVSGQTITLETEGPGPDGKVIKMKDVIEVKGKDHKVLTSQMLGEDGKWVTFMTLHARRRP